MIVEIITDGAATSIKVSGWAVILAGAALCVGWKFADLYLSIIEKAALLTLKKFRAWRAAKPSTSIASLIVRRPWPTNVPPPKRRTAPTSRRRH